MQHTFKWIVEIHWLNSGRLIEFIRVEYNLESSEKK